MKSNNFIKKIENKNILIMEANKLRKLRLISKKTDLFDVPEVLEVNTQKRYLCLQKIKNAIELRKYLIKHNNIFFPHIKKLNRLYFRLGRIIGHIHNNLKLPLKELIGIRGFDKKEFCFLHGDLGLSNILIGVDKIWIIDPSVNNFQDKVYLFGPYYYDLAHISAYTDIIMPLIYLPFYKKKNIPYLEKALVLGYEKERGIKVNLKKLGDMKRILLINYYRATINKKGFFNYMRKKIVENELRNY